MSEVPTTAAQPDLHVDDTVLAKIAAFEAAQTPGVARLHPYAMQAARQAVSSVARRATARLVGDDAAGPAPAGAGVADPAGVDVERDEPTGALTLTIRIVASTRPPILGVVKEVQQRVNLRIAELAGIVPVVVVNVLDVDIDGPDTEVR